LVRFPFSDLSQTKLRPAVALAEARRGDWVLCQVTSNGYGDPAAITLEQSDFTSGSLRTTSFARPLKLFTASDTIFASQVGSLNNAALRRIILAIVAAIQPRS
jgi:mRNA interferase MazF